jgi:spermidine synthase
MNARLTTRLGALALGLAVAVGIGGAPAADAASRIVFTKKSLYRNIMVSDEGDRICMTFRLQNGQVHALQSCMYKADHDKLVFDYAKATMAGLLAAPQPKRILVLGLGGGSIPRVFRKLYPAASIDVVEIDEAVVQTAAEWFDFRAGGNLKVHIKDGRQFVKQAGVFAQKYDLILLDAFNGDYIPEHLMTREFLQECQRILTPTGVLVANTFSASRLYDSESATYAAVFERFINLKREEGNRIILARNGAPLTLAQLKMMVPTVAPKLAPYGVDYDKVLADAKTAPDWDPKAKLLTDDWNPANVMRGQ